MVDKVISLDSSRAALDKRQYRLLLLENGVKCLLISETNAQKSDLEVEKKQEDVETSQMSALSVSVNVGSLADPIECQGCAHFLEHLLFMGSEKYPEENYYDDFVSTNGGFTNAYTDNEETVYYFDIVPEHFFKAVDIVAQFFKAPKMHESSVERELEAIQSEFDSAKNSTSVRLSSVLKALAKDEHPASKFGYGNKESIGNNYEAMKSFHKSYYYSHRLSLCAISSHTLDEMQKEIQSNFSNCRQSSAKTSQTQFNYFPKRTEFLKLLKNMNSDKFPYKANDLNSLHVIKSSKDINRLDIIFQLPSLYCLYESKTDSILSHLIGDEIEGSLFHFLKEKQLCMNLCTSFESDSSHSLFIISLFVPESAVTETNIELIITLVYEYLCFLSQKIQNSLTTLSGVMETETEAHDTTLDCLLDNSYNLKKISYEQDDMVRIFNELKVLSEVDYEYRENKDNVDQAVDYTTLLTSGVTTFEHLLKFNTIYKYCDIYLMNSILKSFISNKGLYFLTTPKQQLFNSSSLELKKTKYFDVKYYKSKQIFDLNLATLTTNGLKKFYLPKPNVYIPTNFDLTSINDSKVNLVKDSDNVNLCTYYSKDVKLTLPKVKVYILISLVKDLSLIEFSLYFSLLRYIFNTEIYLASLASTELYIKINQTKSIEIQFNGYSHKLLSFVSFIVNKLYSYLHDKSSSKLSNLENGLKVCKEKLKLSINNTYKVSKNYSRYLRLSCLYKSLLNKETKLKYLNESSFSSLSSIFSPKAKVNIKSYLHGNTSKQYINEYLSILKEVDINYVDTAEINKDNNKILSLEDVDTLLIKRECEDIKEDNNSIEIYYEIGYEQDNKNIRIKVLNELLDHIISEPYFDELRTKQQLGYDVSNFTTYNKGVLGYVFKIVSSTHAPLAVIESIQNFIKSYYLKLKKMKKNKFDNYVNSLIMKKLTEPKTLDDDSYQNWQEIMIGRYNFNYLKDFVACLRTISIDEIISFYQQTILNFKKRIIIIVTAQEKEKKKKELQQPSKGFILKATHISNIAKDIYSKESQFKFYN